MAGQQDASRSAGGRRDVFISYAGPDRPWAEWAAAQLEAARYSIELDVWDWAVGDNVVVRMNDALHRADRVLALWSPAYFERDRFTTSEWTALIGEGPDFDGRFRLVPLRVARVTPPPLLKSLAYRDLFDLEETRARAVLLNAVGTVEGRGRTAPFPGKNGSGDPAVEIVGPRVPGTLPRIWNVPRRNRAFTGRQSLLAALHERVAGGGRTLVQALNGMGGVGKTQLVIEYAHLFAGDYDLVWWIDAERPQLIGDQVSRLAQSAGWVAADETVAMAWERVADQLRRTDRWLLVFDNAEDPAHVDPWLPQGPGQVLITSRHRGFTDLAAVVDVELFARAESVDLLDAHLPHLSPGDADRLAEALGDLPLALAQAAGLLAETSMTVPEYLQELTAHGREILTEHRPLGYPVSLAAGVEISLTRLRDLEPAAIDLLRLAAVLAPEPIPLDWLRTALPDTFSADLRAVAARPLALRRTLARLADLGLATITGGAMQVHRLVQAVLRDQRTDNELVADRFRVIQLVSAAEPVETDDPATWPAWGALIPHLLALDPATAPPQIRGIACNALRYLLRRGQYQPALPLAQAWYTQWLSIDGPDDEHVLTAADQLASAQALLARHREAIGLHQNVLERRSRTLGSDHPLTLSSARALANTLRGLGRYQEALDLHEETLDRYRRALGPDHPDTLFSASNVASVLRDLERYQEALVLHQDILDRRRRTLGHDHPRTLFSACSLAADLRAMHRHAESLQLVQDALERRRRVLGADHPDTLSSASNLATDLRELGRYQEAHDLDADTLDRRRRVLGWDHPRTLSSARHLASDLRALGRCEEAQDLGGPTRRCPQPGAPAGRQGCDTGDAAGPGLVMTPPEAEASGEPSARPIRDQRDSAGE